MDTEIENEASFDAVVMSHTDDDCVTDDMDSNFSAEENADNTYCSRSENNTMEQHFSGIEKMVHELKQGFVEVMEALSVMQDGDNSVKRELAQMSKTLETVQTDQNDMRHHQAEEEEANKKNICDIKSLKSEISCLSNRLGSSIQTQERLQEKVQLLQAERNLLVEELSRSGTISERVRLQLSDNKAMAPTHCSWPGCESDSLPDHSAEHVNHTQGSIVDSSVEGGVTASACKCLSLLQALEEKCRLPELPDSSDDDAFQQWSQTVDHQGYKDDKSSTQQSFPSPNSNPADVQTVDTERQEAVQGIIDSEKEYILRLWSLLDGYLGPIQAGHMISTRELSLLLPPYLQQMYEQHKQILQLLQERILHWNWSGIVGDVLARITDTQQDSLMSLYKNYLADFPAVVSCLKRQLAQSRKFRMFIKRETNSEGIVSLLTAPIRRIPRYSLLLQQLLKHTPTMHPDHYILQCSLSRLQSFVDQFSEQIKQSLSVDKDPARTGSLSFRSSPSGSSCDAGTLPSARETLVHEEQESRRGFMNNRENYLPQWIESSITERQEYQDAKLVSMSQPDLAYGRFSAPLERHNQTYSAYGGPPAFTDKNSVHRKYRIKKRLDRDAANYRNYRVASQTNLPPIYNMAYHTAPIQNRPASAIDFIPAYGMSAVRPVQNHVYRRPQSAMSGSLLSDARTKSLHNQLLNRKYSDGFSNSHDNLFPGSRSSHSITPSPRDSPRVIVTGNVDGIHEYCERSEGLFTNEDEDDTRADTTTAYGYDGYREDEMENAEDLKLAASLAESLRNDRELDNPTNDYEHSRSVINVPFRNSNTESREYLQKLESGHLPETVIKNSVANYPELRLDIKSLQDDHVDALSQGKHSEHSDSTYLPNSTFEESVRSDSNNSGNHLIHDSIMNGFPENHHKLPLEHLNLQTKPGRDSLGFSPMGVKDSQTRELNTNSENTLKDCSLNEEVIVENGEIHHDGISKLQPVSLPVSQLRETEGRRGLQTSTMSCDERILLSSNKDMTSSAEVFEQDVKNNSRNGTQSKVRHTFGNSEEIQNSLIKNDERKKKKDVKQYNSMENLSKCSDDIIGGKKSHFKSLKHFFGKKNGLLANLSLLKVNRTNTDGGSVRLDQLEAAYFKQHGYTNRVCENKPSVYRGDYSLQATHENNTVDNNNGSKESSVEGDNSTGKIKDKTMNKSNQLCGTPFKENCLNAGQGDLIVPSNSSSNSPYRAGKDTKHEQTNTSMKKKKSSLFFIFRDGQDSSIV